MDIFRKNDRRCPVCLHVFNAEAMMKLGKKGCPVCHTVLQPLETKYDGYIRINWQDIRTLAIYARRWSKIFDIKAAGDKDALAALQNIFNALSRFRPVGAQPLLPDKDIVADTLRRVEVKEGGGMMIKQPEKTEPDGSIISPFFGKF